MEGEERFKVPGVTTICGIVDKSPALMGWAVKCAIETCRGAITPDVPHTELFLEQVFEQAKKAHRLKKEEAADIGKEAHGYLEAHFKGTEFVLPPEENPARQSYDAALSWVAQHEVKTLEVERRVYSRRHRVSGTLDQLAYVDGELALIDWKTGKRLYPEHRMQTAMYVAMREEEGCEQIKKRYLVRTGDPIEVHEFGRKEFREDFRTFLGALTLYNGLRGMN